MSQVFDLSNLKFVFVIFHFLFCFSLVCQSSCQDYRRLAYGRLAQQGHESLLSALMVNSLNRAAYLNADQCQNNTSCSLFYFCRQAVLLLKTRDSL